MVRACRGTCLTAANGTRWKLGERCALHHARPRDLLVNVALGRPATRAASASFCAIELVKSKETRETWGMGHPYLKRLNELTNERCLLSHVWDVVHVAPPLVTDRAVIDRIVAILDDRLAIAERVFGLA